MDGALAYGHGSSDMKGPVAALLLAAARWADAGDAAGRLAARAHRRRGGGQRVGRRGARAAQRAIDADAMVIGEPSGLREPWEALFVSSRGICCFEVDDQGRQGHSGLSELLPPSATVAAARVITALAALEPSHPAIPGFDAHPTVNAGVLSGGRRVLRRPPRRGARGVRGAHGPRHGPGHARARGARGGGGRGAGRPRVGSAASARTGSAGCRRRWRSPDHPVVAAALEACADALGRTPPVAAYPAGTDATAFSLSRAAVRRQPGPWVHHVRPRARRAHPARRPAGGGRPVHRRWRIATWPMRPRPRYCTTEMASITDIDSTPPSGEAKALVKGIAVLNALAAEPAGLTLREVAHRRGPDQGDGAPPPRLADRRADRAPAGRRRLRARKPLRRPRRGLPGRDRHPLGGARGHAAAGHRHRRDVPPRHPQRRPHRVHREARQPAPDPHVLPRRRHEPGRDDEPRQGDPRLLPRRRRGRRLRRRDPPADRATVTDPAEARRRLGEVRARGYAIDDVENEDGIRCVAAPILDHAAAPVAGLSISGPEHRVTAERVEELGAAVRSAAERVSNGLGYRGSLPPAG